MKSLFLMIAVIAGAAQVGAADDSLSSKLSISTGALATFSLDHPRVIDLKGWDYLYRRLVASGIRASVAAAVLSDARMPEREELFFSLQPHESGALYRRRNTREERDNALSFYREHEPAFRAAQTEFGVPPSIILALLQIETHCGSYTGDHPVFFRLARLASAASPDNIEVNFRHHRALDPAVKRAEVEERAHWLEQTFLPSVTASFQIAGKYGISPLELKGSLAGARGIPQFLPANEIKYGVDADRDGRIDLFSPADAIFSVANFLSKNGWRRDILSAKEKRAVLYRYNHSTPYVETALSMSSSLNHEILHPQRKAVFFAKRS